MGSRKNPNNNRNEEGRREPYSSESETEEDSMADIGCSKCSKKVKSNGVQCGECDTWYHNSCAKVSKDQCKVLQEISGCSWYCGRCSGKQKNLITENSRLRERYEEVKDRLESLEIIMGDLREEIRNLTANVGQGRSGSLTLEEVRNEVREEIKEQNEREKKKNNIVMYNIEESTKAERDERLKACGEIISGELGMTNVEIVEVSRLGKVEEASGNTRRNQKPRPVLVKLRNPGEKWGIIAQGKRLKNSENEKVKNVFIAPDLTMKEREHEKKLREELQIKKDNGEMGWYIKKGELRRNENFQRNQYNQRNGQ